VKIGTKILSSPLRKAGLTARFAVDSFICIGGMTLALWFIVSNYLINSLLEREWETTAQFVIADAKEYLTAEDFRTKDRQSVGHKFDALFHHLVLLPNIVRFKVYNPEGVVIWSDDKRLVGSSFADNEQLQQALRGRVVADVSSLTKKENVFEHDYQRLVEVYVPIYSDNSRELLGVFETYKRADPMYRDIREARMVVLMGALGGGLLLYLSLFAIVRQAARKINEQQANLFKMQSQLVASQRLAAVGEMAAAVAHGIGNPLSSIRAAAQVATLDCRTEGASAHSRQTLDSLQSIIQQVDRVQKRMQGLLNFARPMEPRPGPVEVNLLLRDVVTILKPRFEEAEVSPLLELDLTLPQAALDPNHLEQVFMVLITNALEATPAGGKVTITTSGRNGNGRAVRVSIQDTGEGIPEENRERVFEPFFTTKPNGTGIGLPLAKKFVERNGGTITISNGGHSGTRIDVEFPFMTS
jgi:two-component system, NtrC family, sensor histidine kinase HydH